MIPYVHVDVDFEPDNNDIGELYESLRAMLEQLRPFSVRNVRFNVSMRNNDDEELPTF